MNVPVWIGVAVAVLLLLFGFAGLALGGGLVVQQLRRRSLNQQHRARKIAELKQLPHRSTQIMPSSQRQTMPVMNGPALGAPGVGGGPGLDATLDPKANPTLTPDDDVDVPTAVFKASQYADIEALMKDANKYVDDHNKGRPSKPPGKPR